MPPAKKKSAAKQITQEQQDELLFSELAKTLQEKDASSQVYYGTKAFTVKVKEGNKIIEKTIRPVKDMDVPGFIKTPLTLVNLVSGGGVPLCRMHEIIGGSSDGKTAWLRCLEAECQRMGGKVSHYDEEISVDTGMAQALGVNTEEGWIGNRATSIQTVFDGTHRSMLHMRPLEARLVPFLVTVDSLATIPIDMTGVPDYWKLDNYLRPRVISDCLNKFTIAMMTGYGTIAFVNQVRHKVEHNMMKAKYMAEDEKVVATGGKAREFALTFQIQFLRKGKIYLTKGKRKMPVGIKGRLIIAKSRVGEPYTNIPYFYYFKNVGRYRVGFNDHESVLTYLAEQGIVKCKGTNADGSESFGFKDPKITLLDGTEVGDKSIFDLAWFFQQRENKPLWDQVVAIADTTLSGTDLGTEATSAEEEEETDGDPNVLSPGDKTEDDAIED